MSIEREILYRMRVVGADDMASAFQKVNAAASRAYDEVKKKAVSTSTAIAREEERNSKETLRTRMLDWKLQQQEAKRTADEEIRQRQRAAREAEANARRVDALQNEANKKFLAGTQQAVAAITSVARSAVLAWAANEEQAESMLRTLAGFEAGAQLLQGTIDGIQAIVTMWEAAEAASKAYALSQAATTAVGVGSGAVTVGGAAGAGAAAAGGGVMGTLGGAFAWLSSAASAAAAALVPLVAVGTSLGLALGEMIYRVTGNESFSTGGAAEGAYKLAGFGYTGEKGVADNQRLLEASRNAQGDQFARRMSQSDQVRAMRGFDDSFAIGGGSVQEQLARAQNRFRYASARVDTYGEAISGAGLGSGRQVGNLNALNAIQLQNGKEALQQLKEIYDLEKLAGELRVSSLQKSINLAKMASDAAQAQLKSVMDQRRTAAERVANMSPEDLLTLNSALAKSADPVGKGAYNLPEANALSAMGLDKARLDGFFSAQMRSLSPLLTERFDIRENDSRARADRTGADLASRVDAARSEKDIKVEGTIDTNIVLTFDEGDLRKKFEEIIQMLAKKVMPSQQSELERLAGEAVLARAGKG